MFCLNCKVSSPPGSSFCTGCGRSLGCRVCDKGHRCPSGARRCGECGSQSLSDPAMALSLQAVSRSACWIGAAAVAYWSLHHLWLVSVTAWDLGIWCAGTLFDWNRPYSCRLASAAIDWVLVLWVVSLFLPKEQGARLRQRLWAAVTFVGKSTWKLLRWCAGATYRLIEGASATAKKPRKK